MASNSLDISHSGGLTNNANSAGLTSSGSASTTTDMASHNIKSVAASSQPNVPSSSNDPMQVIKEYLNISKRENTYYL